MEGPVRIEVPVKDEEVVLIHLKLSKCVADWIWPVQERCDASALPQADMEQL